MLIYDHYLRILYSVPKEKTQGIDYFSSGGAHIQQNTIKIAIKAMHHRHKQCCRWHVSIASWIKCWLYRALIIFVVINETFVYLRLRVYKHVLFVFSCTYIYIFFFYLLVLFIFLYTYKYLIILYVVYILYLIILF